MDGYHDLVGNGSDRHHRDLRGNYADFWFNSVIVDGIAMLVNIRVQRCVAIPMLVFELWQRGRVANIVKCEPLTRGNYRD